MREHITSRNTGSAGLISPWLERHGLTVCAGWGLAEATLFFIVPDVMISLVALYHPRRALQAAAVALAGALVGGALLYGAAQANPTATLRMVERVPAISTPMIELAGEEIHDRGGMAIVVAPAKGTPYKIYAAEWSRQDRSWWTLLAWTLPARAIRFFGAAIGAALAGLILRRLLPHRPDLWITPHVALWIVIYASYFWTNGF